MSQPLLAVNQVVKRFGGFRALDGVSFSVAKGEVLGLVGPNGSGKTTCINVISGLYSPDAGEVRFKNVLCNHHPMDKMARLGLNRTFQIPKPFFSLTVEQNIEIARRNTKPNHSIVDDPLAFVGLSSQARRLASTLNSSQQKLLGLARALATGPELLLVDELGAGLNPSELASVADKLQWLSQQGIAMVVVEHLMGFVHQLTQRVIVMNAGREIFEGNLEQAAEDPQVVEVYLGG
jgi:branched-chain amino acid transport system ATP-binding protein